MAHAALIAYPRYSDPVTGRTLSPEAALERLAVAPQPRPSVPAVLQRARARLRRPVLSQT